MGTRLSEMQQKVFDILDAKPNTDIPLSVLYDAVYHPDNQLSLLPETYRDIQQKMGPLISRINAKLKRGRITPGKMKQTYRLNTKHKA